MRVTAIVSAALLGALLVGCAGQPSEGAGPSTGPSAEPSASETAPAVVEDFGLPAACLDILPASRLSQFESAGLVLLGGPDGLYGDDYLLDPSPEQRVGGITCIWGPPDTELSTVTISVAPLSASDRPAIVDDLAVSQGLNESVGEDAAYYWQLGDSDRQPAILNVLAADSWISVIQTIGGDATYAEAEDLAAEVHDLVYS